MANKYSRQGRSGGPITPRNVKPDAREVALRDRKLPPAPVVPPDWKSLADRYARPVLIALLVLGFLVRVINLDALTLWVDEFVHVQRAQDFLAGKGPLFADDNNGILLTALIVPLFKLFGPEAFWARLPSVFFGVGMLFLLYRMGTRLFNRYVGLLAAFAGVFSLYLNFWSRMARNYAIFGFFFLLLGLVFLAAMEGKTDRTSPRFWEKYGLAPRPLLWLPLVLVAALLSHQLAFLFGFTAAAYAIVLAAGKMARGADDRFNNKYLWISAIALPFLLCLFVPALNGVIKGILGAVLPARIVDWVVPQWSRLAELWTTKPWEAFQVYHGVIRYDPSFLYFAGLAGFVAAWWLRPKSGAWLASSFFVPFLLMSFLFREPYDPRYMMAAFPYFLIAVAAFFYAAWVYLTQKLVPDMFNSGRWALLVLPFVLVVSSVRWPEWKKLVLAEQLSGHVVDMNVATWTFTNWKQPSDYVKKNGRPGDLVLATIPTAARYYLQNDQVLWFRQLHLNTQLKRYELNTPEPGQYSAATFEDLQRTVRNAPRGWLLADYYFDSGFTDDRARHFIYQNLQFYPEASADGSVMLFGWDNAQPKPAQQNLVVELGKAGDKLYSEPLMLTLPEAFFQQPALEMTVRARGVNSPQEAFILFNDENAVYLPVNKGKGVETMTLSIRPEWLKRGANKVEVGYNDKIKSDPDKGFTLYFMSWL